MKLSRPLVLGLCLMLCAALSIGGTMAYFTDVVEVKNNIVEAGNLDIELYRGEVSEDNHIHADDTLFALADGQKWEPGMVMVENLTVANVGTQAFNYTLTLDKLAANTVTVSDGVNAGVYDLSDVLYVAYVPQAIDTAALSRAEVLALAEAAKDKAAVEEFVMTGSLTAQEKSKLGALVVYWPSTNENDFDNIFNLNNGRKADDGAAVLTINFGLTAEATQMMFEEDSFGPDYDQFSGVHTTVTGTTAVDPNGLQPGTPAVVYGPAKISGDTALLLEETPAEVRGVVVVRDVEAKVNTLVNMQTRATVFIIDSKLDIPAGGYVVNDQSGDTTTQIWLENVMINGELVTYANVANYYDLFNIGYPGNIVVSNTKYNWTNTDAFIDADNADDYHKPSDATNNSYESLVLDKDVNMPGKTMAYIDVQPKSNVVYVDDAKIVADTVVAMSGNYACYVYLHDLDVTLPEGGYMVDNVGEQYVTVMASNVVINGKLLESWNELVPYLNGNITFGGLLNDEYNHANTENFVTEENVDEMVTPDVIETANGGKNPAVVIPATNAPGKTAMHVSAVPSCNTIVSFDTKIVAENVLVYETEQSGATYAFFEDVDFTIGNKLLINNSSKLIFLQLYNCTINGEKITTVEQVEPYVSGSRIYIDWVE